MAETELAPINLDDISFSSTLGKKEFEPDPVGGGEITSEPKPETPKLAGFEAVSGLLETRRGFTRRLREGRQRAHQHRFRNSRR